MASVKHHIWNRILEKTGIKAEKAPLRLNFRLQQSSIFVRIPETSLACIGINNFDELETLSSDNVIQTVCRTNDKNVGYLDFAVERSQFVKAALAQQVTPVDVTSPKRPIVVDFSSPNVAKPFHMGHFRSTIVGNFVANTLGLASPVKKINYLGDWGTQIGFMKLGLDLKRVSETSLRENPLKELHDAYVEAYNDSTNIDRAREIFCNMETNDTDNEFWDRIRSVTVDNLKKTYSELNIHFDEYAFESQYKAKNIQRVINELIENQVAEHNGEQLVVNIQGKEVPLLREDGSSLYLSRDVAAAIDRINKYDCSKIMYVVDKSQSGHLDNLKDIITRLGFDKMIQHVPFGRVTGMSTRRGTGVFLSDIVEEGFKRMAAQQAESKNTRSFDEDSTRILAISSLIVYILKNRRTRDFSFDWDEALKGTGDSGVKIQYTHARLKSLLELFPRQVNTDCDASCFDDSNLPMITQLARFDEIIEETAVSLESYLLVQYLFKLCNETSRCLKNLPVKGQPDSVAQQRLLLFDRARHTIRIGAEILGIKTLNRM